MTNSLCTSIRKHAFFVHDTQTRGLHTEVRDDMTHKTSVLVGVLDNSDSYWLQQNAPIPNFRSLTNQHSKRPKFLDSKAGNAGDAIQWHLLLIMTVSGDYSQYTASVDRKSIIWSAWQQHSGYRWKRSSRNWKLASLVLLDWSILQSGYRPKLFWLRKLGLRLFTYWL